MNAVFSFLGGSAFRMLWGEFASWLTKRQEHSQEMERMRLQGDLEAAAHARNLEAQRVQADTGIKVIEAQALAKIGEIEASGWLEAVETVGKATGIALVDGWNAIIRPSVATWALVMMTLSEFSIVVMSENSWSVASAALGIYLAERNLLKRGK